MKVFVAGIATETNTFASVPTGLSAFSEYGMRRGDGSGQFSFFAPYDRMLETWAHDEGHELVLSLMADAQPGGITVRSAYEALRDELLAGLRAAIPVQAVILALHGAMVADGYPDCEGDLIERVRQIVGAGVPIGVELDPHCHFTERMRTGADLLIAYKEYPHTDIGERLRDVWRLTLATAAGQIRPVVECFDCRMIGLWHTTREPLKSFVQKMMALEREPGVLSVNLGHGFPMGDVPETGARTWVITDGDRALAARLAEQLGREFWAMREAMTPRFVPVDAAVSRVAAHDGHRPLVLADTADNAGGGASSDSTFILRAIVERRIPNVAIGAFWDLGAVHLCFSAGLGARFQLRVGGKCGPQSGHPVDLIVTVRGLQQVHGQKVFGDTYLGFGPSAWVSTDDGIDLVIVSVRQQVIGLESFTGLGIDLTSKRAIVVKSAQNFHTAFAPLASDVLYVDSPGAMRRDFESIPYVHRQPNYWPRVADPWSD